MNKDTIYINLRFLDEGELTGVGRFGYEISKRLKILQPHIIFIGPKTIHQQYILEFNIQTFGKFKGAFWEQVELPVYLWNRKGVLLNLANTAPLFSNKKLITVIHDIIPLTNPEWFSVQARNYYGFIMPSSIKKSSLIITVSNFNRNEISRVLKTPLNKIKVVHNGVDSFWKPSNDVPMYEDYILTVASMDPRKNLKGLVESFLRIKNIKTKLIIVGHKHKAFRNQDIKISEEDQDRIVFTGFVPDNVVVNLYTHAKAFVYPSLKEGFGIPPLEAMACNCPVIASDRTSIPEVCMDAALYINPDDPNSIAQAIEKLLHSPEMVDSLVEKGRARVKKFTWETAALKVSGILSGKE